MSADHDVPTAADPLAVPFADEPCTGRVLTARGIGVQFGGIEALSGISFDLDAGEVVAIIGPNGAGKTTLLNTLCGVAQGASVGEIELKGRSIGGARSDTIAAAGVGRSFQSPPLLDHETVTANVLVGMHHRIDYSLFTQVFRPLHVRQTERELTDRVHALLDAVGLRDLADHQVAGLPYGTRKLIDITRALASGPDLLMLDEPTSGLDFTEQAKVRDLLLRLRATGKITILIVEHHMEIVRSVATKVLGLQAGTLVMQGTPAEVLDSEAFRAAIIGGTPR